MKKPLLIAVLAMTGLLASVAHAELDLRPKGQGFSFGQNKRLHLSPVLNVGAFWESNARNTSNNEKSGGGWRVQPSLTLSYAGKENGKDLGNFSLSGFYSMERGFDSKNAQDSDSYGFNATMHRNLGRRLTLSGSVSYSRSEDDQFYGEMWNGNYLSRVDTTRSENYNANISLGYRSDRYQGSVGLGWSRSRQLDGWKNQSDSYNLNMMVGKAVAAHHYANVSFSTSWDDADDNSQAYYLMVGMNGSLSERWSYSAMAGLGIYDYSGYQDDTKVGPSYTVSAAYKFNRTFAGSLAMSAQFEPEYDWDQRSYYIWSNDLTAALNAQWNERWSSRLNVAWSYEDHLGNSGEADYDRTYIQTSFSTSVRVNSFMSLYGSVSWKTDMYSDRNDTDDYRADVGLTFRL